MKNEKGSEDFCMWKFCFIKCFRSTQRKLALLYYYLYVYVNVYMYMYMTCIRIAHSLKTPSLLCHSLKTPGLLFEDTLLLFEDTLFDSLKTPSLLCQPPHAALFLHRLLPSSSTDCCPLPPQTAPRLLLLPPPLSLSRALACKHSACMGPLALQPFRLPLTLPFENTF